jgi:hypothetical protein
VPVTTDIVSAWRRPRVMMRSHLARTPSEPWAFALLTTFMIVAFIAQWPGASRTSHENPAVPLEPQLLAMALGILALIPLWYLLAAISHWIAKLIGGQGDHYGARLALFWALVTVSPLMLLQGLVAGMIGPGPGLTSVTIITGVLFVCFWMLNLIEAER